MRKPMEISISRGKYYLDGTAAGLESAVTLVDGARRLLTFM